MKNEHKKPPGKKDDVIMVEEGHENTDLITVFDDDTGSSGSPKKGSAKGGSLASSQVESDGGQLDPVKSYLREMGAVSLLSSEKEIEIAKKIEWGEKQIQGVVL